MKTEIYPLTIIKDRYNGVYSGASYLAFNQFNDRLDKSIGGSDPEEMIYWEDFKQGEPIGFLNEPMYCGKGNSIQEAYDNLELLLIKNGLLQA